MDARYLKYFEQLRVKEKTDIRLKNFDTDVDMKPMDKETGTAMLQESIKSLSDMQDRLYAHNEHSVLIIFQAMDAAGKDGAIKHVMSGLNPQGVKVTSFKTPSSQELDHDYFWRHYQALPARGEIGIFNRSHYENVLITKVHPEYILGEKIPGISSVKQINEAFWEMRYKQIRRFEKNLSENGTVIIKFFLHVSKKEQKKRFLDRIDDPKKNWKFAASDVGERQFWDQYQKAYEDAISSTSTDYAPWFIIPADDKWFTRLAIAAIIYSQIGRLKFSYPELSEKDRLRLAEARKQLMDEED